MSKPSASPFQRLAATHAAMVAGDASMVVALADSFFFDVDPHGARSRVLAFLLISFAPFLLIAPLIGPAIDRMPGGRQLVVRLMAIVRIALAVAMSWYADSIVLFPLVFVALVAGKSYAVAKSSLVPSVVSSGRDLVEANSKLGVIAGLAGAVAVVPAGLIQLTLGTPATLLYSGCWFAAGVAASLRLPSAVVSPDQPGDDDLDETDQLELGWVAMVTLRAAAGFMLFHLAFWYRGLPDEKLLIGAAVALSAASTMLGNLAAPRIRDRIDEERMLLVALGLPAVTGVLGAMVGGPWFGVIVVMSVSAAGSIGRMSFESLVQRDARGADRGRVFARYELRFQLAWVIAAVLPVLVEIPGLVGLGLVGAVFVGAVVNYAAGLREAEERWPPAARGDEE